MADQNEQFHQTEASYVGFVQAVGTGDNTFDQYQVHLANGIQGYSYAKSGNNLSFKQGDKGKFKVTVDKKGYYKINFMKENSGKKFSKGGYSKSKEEIALNSATAMVSNMAAALITSGKSINTFQASQQVLKVAGEFLAFLNAGSSFSSSVTKEQSQPQAIASAPPKQNTPPLANQGEFNPPQNPNAMANMTGNQPATPPQANDSAQAVENSLDAPF